MNIISIRIIFSVLFIFVSLISYAQNDKDKLKKEKEQIEEEIKYTSKLLKETQNTKRASLNELVLLKRKIEKRENLIESYNAGIYYLNHEIKYNNDQLEKLSKDLEKLREEYAKMICAANKNRSSYKRLMFIFSSEDFNQDVESMQIEHSSVPEAKAGDSIGIKVIQKVHPGDKVFKVIA